MAMRRRRRFTRSFAGKRAGRSFYWFRFGAFNLTVRDSANGVLSDVVLDESDWANPSLQPNQTRRGGPRLERFILNYGFALEANAAYFQTAGDGNIAWIPEFLVWKQSDSFGPTITSAASYDVTRRDNRVLMCEVPSLQRELTELSAGTFLRTVQGKYETKSKIRLSEGAIGFAWRTFSDLGDADVLGFTDWVEPTILISVP